MSQRIVEKGENVENFEKNVIRSFHINGEYISTKCCYTIKLMFVSVLNIQVFRNVTKVFPPAF